MGKYKRVNSYKIMKDYETTAKHLKYFSVFADKKDRRFFNINEDKIEDNILSSKMTNKEKNQLLKYIHNRDYHKIYCYALKLEEKYKKKYLEYNKRIDILFMTIEDKNVFYA